MNVCQTCGACCAAFRVDFHPAELAGAAFAWDGGVPLALVVPVTPAIVRMLGTDAVAPRCRALKGEIGREVSCAIYRSRPSPCREFDTGHEACARARQRHGMAPLAGEVIPVPVGKACG